MERLDIQRLFEESPKLMVDSFVKASWNKEVVLAMALNEIAPEWHLQEKQGRGSS